MAENAAAVRQKILALRKTLDPKTLEELSERIVARFLTACAFPPRRWKGQRVALYRAMPGETSLSSLEKWMKEAGAILCYPRIQTESRAIDFFEDAKDWETGPFGIMQPKLGSPQTPPASIEAVFVPGVAFGMNGERVGMGAGFYDRYLVQMPEALRVALTFDFQLFDSVEQNVWDQLVHWVMTEKRDVRTSIADNWLEKKRKKGQ